MSTISFVIFVVICLVLIVGGYLFGASGNRHAKSEGEAIVIVGNMIAGTIIMSTGTLGFILYLIFGGS